MPIVQPTKSTPHHHINPIESLISFCNCYRKSDETTADFADRILNVAQLSLPVMEKKELNKLIKAQFLRGLGDKDVVSKIELTLKVRESLEADENEIKIYDLVQFATSYDTNNEFDTSEREININAMSRNNYSNNSFKHKKNRELNFNGNMENKMSDNRDADSEKNQTTSSKPSTSGQQKPWVKPSSL